jgi:hypothetical protein
VLGTVAALAVICLSSCAGAPSEAQPRAGTTFVEQRSGIAFTIPSDYALVSTKLPGSEQLGEFDFPTFNIVPSISAYQFTYSGSHEPHETSDGSDIVATLALVQTDWLTDWVRLVPTQDQHDIRVGTHAVTVLEQTPTLWGDQIRTYVVVLPHGYGVLLGTSNDTPEADDHVIHTLIESVST